MIEHYTIDIIPWLSVFIKVDTAVVVNELRTRERAFVRRSTIAPSPCSSVASADHGESGVIDYILLLQVSSRSIMKPRKRYLVLDAYPGGTR